MSTQVIAPIGFFTYDAFRAGWFFLWRMCLYTLPAFVVAMIGAAMMIMSLISAGIHGEGTPDQGALTEVVSSGQFWIGVALIFLGSVAAFVISIPVTTKITRAWTQRTWNRTFAGGVWWAISWRVFLVSLLAAAIGQGFNVVIGALTSDTAGLGSNLLGLFLILGVSALNIVVTLLSYGWAMVRVALSRMGGVGVATTVVAGLNPLGYAPTTGPQYSAPPRPAPVTPLRTPRAPSPTAPDPTMPSAPTPVATPAPPAPVMTPRAPAPPPPAPPPPPSGAAATGRRQCPKCSLYETEKGTVLGWYCKVCGWRETPA